MDNSGCLPRLRSAIEKSENDFLNAILDAGSRGYLSHVMVEMNDGRLYPVFFYDPIRLQQDLELDTEHGRAFAAETGMIVVPEITLDSMKNAVERLAEEGFFDYLVPMAKEELALSDLSFWPPRRCKSGG